eukprot:21513_2
MQDLDLVIHLYGLEEELLLVQGQDLIRKRMLKKGALQQLFIIIFQKPKNLKILLKLVQVIQCLVLEMFIFLRLNQKNSINMIKILYRCVIKMNLQLM